MKNNNNTVGNESQSQTNAAPENFSLDKMSNMDIINRCGALRYSLTQIVALLRPRVDPDEINRIILALRTPGSDEYNAYETGLTTADFKLQSQLLDNAGTDKDIYEAFTAEQRRQAINAALADKFGIKTDDE